MTATQDQIELVAEGIARTVADHLRRPTCARCQDAPGTCEVLIDGTRSGRRESWCSDCWNASVRERRETRRAQLDAAPRCEACGTHRANYRSATTDGPVGICGRCLKRANAARSAGMASVPALAGLALFAPVRVTRAELLELAR